MSDLAVTAPVQMPRRMGMAAIAGLSAERLAAASVRAGRKPQASQGRKDFAAPPGWRRCHAGAMPAGLTKRLGESSLLAGRMVLASEAREGIYRFHAKQNEGLSNEALCRLGETIAAWLHGARIVGRSPGPNGYVEVDWQPHYANLPIASEAARIDFIFRVIGSVRASIPGHAYLNSLPAVAGRIRNCAGELADLVAENAELGDCEMTLWTVLRHIEDRTSRETAGHQLDPARAVESLDSARGILGAYLSDLRAAIQSGQTHFADEPSEDAVASAAADWRDPSFGESDTDRIYRQLDQFM